MFGGDDGTGDPVAADAEFLLLRELLVHKERHFAIGGHSDLEASAVLQRFGRLGWTIIQQRLENAGVDDPEDYVRYVFEVKRVPPPVPPVAPKPNHLLSQSRLGEYRRGRADRQSNEIHSFRIRLKSMANAFRSGLVWYADYAELIATGEVESEDGVPSENENMERVLLDESTTMNWLFRYCVALKRCPNLVGTFESVAAYEYVSYRDAYDIAWDKFIPDAVRLRANKLYEEACQLLLRGR